jgi:hypothetical protein
LAGVTRAATAARSRKRFILSASRDVARSVRQRCFQRLERAID